MERTKILPHLDANSAARFIPVALVAVLLATTYAYWPGLWGPFLFDDFPNIIEAPFVAQAHAGWEILRDAALTNQSGLLGRPLSTTSFAVNYLLAGKAFTPLAFKATNLGIHLLCGLVVFGLARALTQRFQGGRDFPETPLTQLLPLTVAGLWLLHPLQLTSVLYVVQRMTSLSALFVFGGLWLFTYGRQGLHANRRGGMLLMLVGVLGGTGLGLACKENAALLPLLALLIELTAFERATLDPHAQRYLATFWICIVALPAVAVLSYVAMHPGFVLQTYALRPFSLDERVLTEARVVFFYLGLLFAPRLDAFSLFHDDILISHDLLAPWTTIVALAGWLAVAAGAAFAWRRNHRVFVFGTGWFVIGHLLESTVLPLEIAYEHRNYLPLFGPLFMLTWYAGRYFSTNAGACRHFCTAAGLTLLLLAVLTQLRAQSWADSSTWIESELRHHPDSARVNLAYGEHMWNQLQPAVAYHHFRNAAQLDNTNVSALIEMSRIALQISAIAHPSAQSDALSPTSWEADLTLDPNGLATLIRLLDLEIRTRIGANAVNATTLIAVAHLGDCIDRRPDPSCVGLRDKALEWIDLLSTRPGGRRASLLYEKGRLLGNRGDLDEAIRTLRLARRLNPADLQLLVYETMLHIRAGDRKGAEALIAELETDRGKPGFHETDLIFLRAEAEE
ncbi:MAG TPA: hypothetical protein VJ673_04715 [Aromatoleum sp.]|uniref:tetratricopeptide repeat protein n=1 Tax=Aromatoleum sp. TaxID=2307007 RepID=UPI002B488CD8|nr:hypothetical protein [Aromatoleum sp.]HJV24964.1 hypothetical protein [Aromatoleum sp.]